jgi:hypothetical protein
VLQCGQTSPASFGTTIAAQLGQEMTLDTELGGNYMTSRLLYFVERFDDPVGNPQPLAVPAA